MTASRVLAVIPSLSVSRLENIKSLANTFEELKFATTVVANGARLDAALRHSGLTVLSHMQNMGFGAAVNLAANSAAGWDWILIVNDDVEVELPELEAAAQKYLVHTDIPTVVYFDDTPPKRIPNAWVVFKSLSLLGGVFKRLQFNRARTSVRGENVYCSFSIVAISRAAWDISGGFDERFAFTYEDADFVRRSSQTGTQFVRAEDHGARHLHSVTGRSYIDFVLPVSAWCGYQYLIKWGSPLIRAKAVCLMALLLRVPFVVLISGSKRKHLLGVRLAIAAILLGRAPRLPDYESV